MWHAFCEHLKDCGRNGTLFALALGLMLALASLGTHGLLALLCLLALGVAWVIIAVAAQRDKFERLGKLPPLPENDLRAARAKLSPQRVRRR